MNLSHQDAEALPDNWMCDFCEAFCDSDVEMESEVPDTDQLQGEGRMACLAEAASHCVADDDDDDDDEEEEEEDEEEDDDDDDEDDDCEGDSDTRGRIRDLRKRLHTLRSLHKG